MAGGTASESDVESLISSLVALWSLAAVRELSADRPPSVRCLIESFTGAYFVMIAFYLHVLRTRRTIKLGFLATATITLFILCTIHCALVLATTILATRRQIRQGPQVPSYTTLIVATEAVYVTANVVADAIFIFRCYAIWNFRLKVVLLPIFLTLAVAVFGYFSAFNHLGLWLLFLISIATSVFTTFVLTALSVGRIWWLAWTARQAMGEKAGSRYHTVCAMILESGALYFTGGLAFVIVAFLGDPEASLTGAVLGQLVGIAPTIIAVRVGLGCSVESIESFIPSPPRNGG
ncbi:hypothetical protein B0H13DRAFT_2387712 [Mycena leptocephala]|nr:hypothetical protein B0H13DRAFT_2387712 [Mycena leptocephala]